MFGSHSDDAFHFSLHVSLNTSSRGFVYTTYVGIELPHDLLISLFLSSGYVYTVISEIAGALKK